MRLIWAFCIAILCIGQTARAQDDQRVVSVVAVIDMDVVFRSSKLGQQTLTSLANRRIALQAENDQIREALIAEEKSLTERRGTMDPIAFRSDADEFDDRVQGIRRARDAAEAALNKDLQDAPKLFLEQVQRTLGQVMLEAGAVALLDKRLVLISLSSVDITQAAIARIDQLFETVAPQE